MGEFNLADLEKLEALEKKATGGDWFVEPDSDDASICDGDGEPVCELYHRHGKVNPERSLGNGPFIVAMRNACPDILVLLRERLEQIEAIRSKT